MWEGMDQALNVRLASHGRQPQVPTSYPSRQPKPTFRVDNILIKDANELDRKLRSFAEQDPDLQRAVAAIETSASSALPFLLPLHYLGRIYAPGCTELESASHIAILADSMESPHSTRTRAEQMSIPGLGSHALGSWKSTNSDEVWLRDFLPKDLPNVRALLYGYDTTLPGSLSKQSIENLGGALLEQINAFRANDGVSKKTHLWPTPKTPYHLFLVRRMLKVIFNCHLSGY
ncbi:uncharacterized protein ACLA_001400 [Aspergillus clavatus NRRL 1]|uniref:Uncharacterized protein n=1 Tax=Aspergillus clavatus (strain ATCC 1007 / CBS 513.65 / DSM 816 / NCTC 3887 / NRRL 1 / QM 1276 / 107) TaxID=344612 RepID=A1C4W1_ASPCL|nr:uncharacterized protein ACLA_001400 [Aspergillus clavatus NRRL 1]EAW14729.1 hypothetical protein ACLA_001400 [Aspergillus clavatus NRRL 1]